MPASWIRRCFRRPHPRPRHSAVVLGFLPLEERTQPAVWQDLSALPASPTNAPAYIHPGHYRAIGFDVASLQSTLAAAPLEYTAGTPVTLALPRPDGTTERFAVVDSPIMEPALAAQFPQMKDYAGQGIDNPANTLRLSVTPLGVQAQVLSPDGAWYVDPYYLGETQTYISYFGHDLNARSVYESVGGVQTGPFRPPMNLDAGEVGSTPVPPPPAGLAGRGGPEGSSPVLLPRNGTLLRSYRLAVATTGEYTQFFGGVTNALAAVNASVNRIVGVWETELSIKMVLVANETSIIYPDPATDPFQNIINGQELLNTQNAIDSVIGDANYDIGHLFSTDPGGGLSYLGAVGQTGIKAKAGTGRSNPVGDAYDINYVAHEVGHQFGANHTFNGTQGFANGNVNSSTAYEPGSGSTIMSYAGITGADDLQPDSDPYFHSASIDEIVQYVNNVVPNAGTSTATGNGIPTVSAGPDVVIPANTPFALTATGSDPNGDALTYTWEERDLGNAIALGSSDNGQSPRFRAYVPAANPTQTFPRLSDLVNNTLAPGDELFKVNRTSNFRVTVRDNRATGGGSDFDDLKLTVVNTGSAFAVTAPNTSGITWQGLSTQTVTWNVAGTTGNGINAANVRILLSTDGGFTYPVTILSGTANDGSETITVPNINATRARIRVEAVGNVFFDISDQNLVINQVVQVIPTIVRDPAQVSPTNAAPVRFDVTFSAPVTGFTASDVQFTGTLAAGLTAVVTQNGPAGDSYFVDVSGMNGTGTVGIGLAQGAVSSVATGAPNFAATTPPIQFVAFDNVAPTVSFVPSSIGMTNQADTAVTVAFSEPVTGFTAASLVPTNAAVQNFVAVAPDRYTFTLRATADGPFSVDVPAGATTDAAGNPNAAAGLTGVLDSTPPTATIVRTSPATIPVEPALFRVSFSEPIVAGSFSASDILFAGSTAAGTLAAQITPVAGSPLAYTVAVTGMTSVGSIRISLGAGAVVDLAGNFNADPAVADADVTLFGSTPSVALSTTTAFPTNAAAVPVTAVFSEKVLGFTAADLGVLNGAVQNFQALPDGKTFTFNVARAADGPFTVTVPVGAGTSALGVPSGSGSLSGSFDATPPLPSFITTATFPVRQSPVPVTVRFSEPVGGFTASDLAITGPAAVANFQALPDGRTFTFDLTRTADGPFTVTVAAGSAADVAGNASLGATLLGTFDTTGPTPAVTAPTTFPTNAAEVPVTVFFPEPVLGFTSADVAVTNGGLTKFQAAGDGQTFTFAVARGSDGPFQVSIPLAAATDLAGNPSNPGALGGTFDSSGSTTTVTTTAKFPTRQASVPVTVTFTEPIAGFTAADLVVANGTVSNFTAVPGGKAYTFDLNRVGDGVFDVTVPAGAGADAAGNPTGGGNLTGTFDTTGLTAQIAPTASAFFNNPVTFTVRLDQAPAAPLTAAGVALGGTAGPTKVVVGTTADPRSFVLTVTGMTQPGTVTAQVVAGTLSDAAGNPSLASDTAQTLFTTVAVTPAAPPPNAGLVGARQFAVGVGEGGSPLVSLVGPDGKTLLQRPAFDPSFTGGVRTAADDLNGDGIAEVVAGTGPGSVTVVRVYDGASGRELFAAQPFEAAFTGGVYVATGDLTGDGTPDLIVTPDEGGGPRVLVYDGKTFALVGNFFGIDDPNFRGGARAAAGDFNGDGRADLVVAAGFGGGPRVAVFDGKTVIGGPNPTRLFNDIFAFEQTLRNGVFVAAGDVDGDRIADLIVGGGPGGAPRVTVYSGAGLFGGLLEFPPVVSNFFAGDTSNRGGARVAAKDLDGDNKADIVVGDGTGAGSRVTAYLGATLTSGRATPAFSVDEFPGFTGGVFVG